MAYHIENFNSWSETQRSLRIQLGIQDDKIRCYPYHGLGHALTDLLYGLKEFWPTRQNIVYSAFGSPFLKEALQGFAKAGLPVFRMDVPRVTGVDEWFNGLPPDLLTLILVRDHCFTGEILIQDEDLQKLNEKRIPHIEVQYGWGMARAALPQPFTAQIRVIDATKAVLVAGHRFRFMPHSASIMNWTELDWDKSIKQLKEHSQEHSEWIMDFERRLQQLQPEVAPFWEKSSSPPLGRLFDRAVFSFDKVNGDFFLEKLLTAVGQPPLLAPGFEFRCETTNLSRWQGPMPWSWWGKVPLTEPEQRTLVVFSTAFLRDVLTPEMLNDIYLQCKGQLSKRWGKVS